MFYFPLSYRKSLVPALLSAAVLLPLAGCGMGGSLPTAAPAFAPAGRTLNGFVHGVPNPIVGAAITLYATSSSGYGATATSLATATTDARGNFTIDSTKFTCPAGQQAYIVSNGGNPGGGTNASSMLMAAMGDCAAMTGASGNVYISEATTVAAAYALVNFTTISGSGAAAVVNIGAPAANNAATPACTGSGSTLSCTAAGLKHAFLNAANLASAASTTASPTGLIYSVPPSNPNGSIPQAMLNTVANAVQACTNSTGGVSGDGSYCGNLFLYTTPPTTSVASPVTPTNTLQAILNLAKYPTLTSANVTNLYSLPPATSYYSPALTAAPSDFSLAIVYKGVTIGTATTAFTYPFFVTTDYTDNVYSANTATSTTGPLTITGMSSNGGSLFSGYTSTTLIAPAMLASDTLGHFFMPNGSSTSGSNVVLELSTTDGSLVNTITLPTSAATGAPYGVAVDPANNVYYSLSTNAVQALYVDLPSSSTVSTAVLAGGSAYTGYSTTTPRALTFDANANLWNQQYSSSKGTNTYYLKNSGTVGAETFAAPVTGVENTSSSNTSGYGIVIDSANNGWVNNVTQLFKVAAAGTTPANTYNVTSSQSGTAVTAGSVRFEAIDGSGNIFLPDNSTASAGSKLWQFYAGTTNFVYMLPCSAPAGATTCASAASVANGGGGTLYGPRNVTVDSTGSLWAASSTNGNIVQVIGPGAPAWPQASLLKSGVKPQ